MRTKLLDAANPADIAETARILCAGGLAAIPTETVYGLAANALKPAAVHKIFAAKGRPGDNPLIVHIAEVAALDVLCADVPDTARLLARRFWPGPLTMVLPRAPVVPDAVTAGLSSVAVRFPANPAARAVLEASVLFWAAPSANRSGSPSPTTAAHVLHDLDGRVDAVLDGGPCDWGVESTVVDLTAAPPRLLRPGGITLEQLREALGPVAVDPAVVGELAPEQAPRAPGMKYRHYAPRAPVMILKGSPDKASAYVHAQKKRACVLCFDEELPFFEPALSYGALADPRSLMRGLVDALRRADALGCDSIYARCPEGDAYAAVQNRLYKAAGFRVTDV